MAIIYKKKLRENPISRDNRKYYPQLVTLGKSVGEDYIAHQIKELSSSKESSEYISRMKMTMKVVEEMREGMH